VPLDAGASWTKRQLPATAPYMLSGIKFASQASGFSLAEGAILYSSDSGATWHRGMLDRSCISDGFLGQDTQGDAGTLSAISGSEAWVGYKHGGLLHTIDGGQRWCEVSDAAGAPRSWGFVGLSFSDSLTAIAATTDHKVQRSRDGGHKWETVGTNQPVVYLESDRTPSLLLTAGGITEVTK
jgi:photosystem II stability/assembly factor-like uncharacterized protein